jgi:hypothetical protein
LHGQRTENHAKYDNNAPSVNGDLATAWHFGI